VKLKKINIHKNPKVGVSRRVDDARNKPEAKIS
jgi:hypothetical protein